MQRIKLTTTAYFETIHGTSHEPTMPPQVGGLFMARLAAGKPRV